MLAPSRALCARSVARVASSSTSSTSSPSGRRAGNFSRLAKRVAVLARARRRKDVQMSEAAWFLDQFKYQQRYKAQTNVFTMPTKELPGGDKLTPEGAAVGALFGALAVWGVSLVVKLLSVTWTLVIASLKYGAIAGVLVFLGVLVS